MKIEIEIQDGQDPSVQCISAISQVMDIFKTRRQGNDEPILTRGLTPMGNDTQSVAAWFIARYSDRTAKFEIKK